MGIWTQADVTAMKTAIASGVLSVRYSGPPERSVQYQDLNAMRVMLAQMVADVNATSGANKGYRLAATRKGLE